MADERTPPRLATRLARLTLPARWRDSAVGDLEEDWRQRSDHGVRGHLWYWRETLGLALGYRLHQLPRRRERHGKRGPGLGGFADDLLAAWRRLRRDSVFSLGAGALLATGIGASIALFTVVHSTLLAPLPYRSAGRIVHVFESQPEAGFLRDEVAPGNLPDWRRAETLAGLTAFYASEAALTSDGLPESLRLGQVTHEFFDVLGIGLLHGRSFTAREGVDAGMDNAGRIHGEEPVVIVDERLWRSRWGADPDLVGSTIRINDARLRVIGIAPATTALPDREVRAWIPLDPEASYRRQARASSRNARFLGAVGRLAPAASLEQARAEMESLAAELARDYPETNAGWTVELVPLGETLVAHARAPLLALTGAAGLLLAVACANLSGMILARAGGRSREIAVRRALGAGSARIVRQLLAESVGVGILGALGALLVGQGLLHAALPLLPADLPRPVDASLHPLAAAVALALGVLAGAASGLLPAWQLARARLSFAAGPRATDDAGTARAGRALVVAEIALAMALVAGAGLLLRSFVRLVAADPGFEPAAVITGRINLEAESSASAASRVAFFELLRERLLTLPGVVAAGGATYLPMSDVGPDFDRPYWRQGEPNPGGDAPRGAIRIVTPGYLETLEVPLLEGRMFDSDDRFDFGGGGGPRVAIVNRALATATWPQGTAVGRVLVMDYPGDTYEYRVVGVVGDVRSHRLGEPPSREIFLPYYQIPYPGLTLALRATGPPELLAGPLARVVADLNPRQPVDRVRLLQRLVSGTVAGERFAVSLLGAFGAAATLLAGLGVYGLVALQVRRRVREMGIRFAVGARPRDVRRLVLLSGARMAAAGIVLGCALFALVARLLEGLLYRTDPLDPVPVAATATVLATVTLAAAWLPALRAARLDPVEALRRD